MRTTKTKQYKSKSIFMLATLAATFLLVQACTTEDGDIDAPGAPGSDTASGTPTGTGEKTTMDPDGDGIVDDMSLVTGNCANVLPITVRDFNAAHPDFEIAIPNDNAWPSWVIRNFVAQDLGADKTPVFSNVDACWVSEGGDCFPMATHWPSSVANPTPLAFNDWYHDNPGVNVTLEKGIVLSPDASGSSVFASQVFFPIGNDEGFGAEAGQLTSDGVSYNFLFTTEIHTSFEYTGGEKFSFLGDDDVWVFVNNKLALDLGSLHPELGGTIDFDAMAADLGIEVGNTYDLDVFHAERHTDSSNFRIETTIECFVPIIE